MKVFLGACQLVALLLVATTIILLLFGVTGAATLTAWVALGLFTFNAITGVGFNYGLKAGMEAR